MRPSGYETKYASDHYSFKDGDTQLILGLTVRAESI